MKYAFCLLCATALFFISACNSLDDVNERHDYVEPRLKGLSFFAADNPLQLVDDITCIITGDGAVECWVSHIMTDKNLRAHFEYDGDSVTIDGIGIVNNLTVIDYRKPVCLKIFSSSISKSYTVSVHSFTGLPIMWIETEGRKDIASKDVYQRASFKLMEDVRTRAVGDVITGSVSIKGRGNTTWGMPKKPYRLKFDKKVSLIDEPEDKSWVLLNNYADKTMLRNKTAFYMSEISNLEYTPRSHFVELILNGQYNGTYLLCEKLKIAKHRVNVGDNGFLLEFDNKTAAGDVTFKISHWNTPINIKEPDSIAMDTDKYRYVKEYVCTCDSVLYSENFADPDNGWQKYMDMDSFVDWYLINEITKNNDACFHTSCYMNLRRGGKLKMGPVWDFDIALGNVDYNENFYPDGFWLKDKSWFDRFFQDPAFIVRVKERFDYFYSYKDDIIREINENAQYLKYAVQENENKWHTFYTYTWPNYDIYGSYQNEVQQMKEWLLIRFEWLKAAFDRM